MDLKNIKYWIIIVVLIGMISCEKEIKNGTLPEFAQKLVITSFISPGDTISLINVDSNRRIYGELGITEQLGSLTAFISDETKEIPLERTISGFMFRPDDISIEEGKTYNLKVISDKGLTAESSCYVPINRNFDIKVDTFSQTATYPDRYRSLMAKISITDYPGEDNYYRLHCEQEVYYSHSDLPFHFINMFSGFKNEFSTDNGKDGDNIEITSFEINNVTSCDSSLFRIYLLNTNKAYYDYHLSLNNYSGGDDPFTEVSPVYSNITGGLGIFAAYTIDSLIFRLK
jgi:hypothetical protein